MISHFSSLNKQHYLLDNQASTAAAYSIRLLRSNYTGSCIRVRRSNDNAETDIGFTGLGLLNTGAILSFATTNSAYVTTWYDQSGNGNNRTQPTAAAQPRVSNAGAIDTLSGFPAIYFPGTARLAGTSITSNTAISTFIVLNNQKGSLGTTLNTTVLFDNGTNQWAYATANAATSAYGQATAPSNAYKNGSSVATSTRANMQSILTGTSMMQISFCNWNRDATWGTGLGLMGYGVTLPPSGGGSDYQGYCLEEVHYYGDKNADRLVVEELIRDYYGL